MDERSDDVLTVADLVAACYPGTNLPEKKHRVSVARAAMKACLRKGWIWRHEEAPGGINVYYNPADIRSYTLGRLRTDHTNIDVDTGELRAFLDGGPAPRHWLKRYREIMQPGQSWWLHVEIHKAERDGRTDDHKRLTAELTAIISTLLKASG